MMTVNDVSKLTGVSIRTLHYYDEIDLLHPSDVTESGYRLYDEMALEKLQQILFFRELQFSLKDIQKILNTPDFDRNKALAQQITLLTLKKERLENLIVYAREIVEKGDNTMDFKAFDTSKIDEYTKQVKEQWGDTKAYKEYEQKTKGQSKESQQKVSEGLMELFVEFGKLMELSPDSTMPQQQVKKLQDYITRHFYNCTKEILSGLGKMYSAGGDFTENINNVGGKGCAQYVTKAIDIYCSK